MCVNFRMSRPPLDPTLPSDEQPDPGARRSWTRSGREEFVDAAIAYLDGFGGDAPDRALGEIPTVRTAAEQVPELGIRLVATLVGKSPSAPLFHFPDRLTLVAAVAAEGFRRLSLHLQHTAGSLTASGTDQLAIAAAIALEYVDWAGDHAALFATMYTPALAAGVDAIQSGDREYWHEPKSAAHKESDEAMSLRDPEGRRRLAFQELHDAKAATALIFYAGVERARTTGALRRDASSADLMNAVIAMADGLAWQRVNERQQTRRVMRRHAECSIGLLLSGLQAPS